MGVRSLYRHIVNENEVLLPTFTSTRLRIDTWRKNDLNDIIPSNINAFTVLINRKLNTNKNDIEREVGEVRSSVRNIRNITLKTSQVILYRPSTERKKRRHFRTRIPFILQSIKISPPPSPSIWTPTVLFFLSQKKGRELTFRLRSVLRGTRDPWHRTGCCQRMSI